ncbi:hypothetical protein Micbo1qcDRAFT_185157 [Microdochium bolleyi]|uniref:FAD-binding domain-containing protein n=1 Tax=Microdochium bolleyi TaxID=196109 RepID=A0A136ITM3_9PEZI|nr:hypothetical protein Micbo1qcDRAFT_185157 [Microdochium bolleyi]
MADRDIDVAVIGGGSAGLATALAAVKAGLSARIYERYTHARPAGTILNLWAPPMHALECMGVNMEDVGAPCRSLFCKNTGALRAEITNPDIGPGFVGLLRPDLYARMVDALPDGVIEFNRNLTSIDDKGSHVQLTFADGAVVRAGVLIGADGIDSFVRKHLWGDNPRRNHDLAIIGGYTYNIPDESKLGQCVIMHDRQVQAAYSTILSNGRIGQQWWVLESWPDAKEAPADLRAHALEKAQGFAGPFEELITSSPESNLQRWSIRDHVPLKKWARGRISLAGDAAHATSPYAGYGAGMSICDGYFIGQKLYGVDISDTKAVEAALAAYVTCQRDHTNKQVNQAYMLGKLFHYTPFPLNILRDAVLDWTPLMQWQMGEANPKEIIAQLKVMGQGITA